MEKRTLLAFALSIAVFIIWSYFFSPTPQQPQAPVPETASPAQEPARPEPVRVQPAETKISPPPVLDQPSLARTGTETFQDRDVTIKTDLYTAIFTEAGGRLRSFTLHDYRDSAEPGSPPKQLVTVDAPDELPLGVSFLQDSIPELSRVHYSADQTLITLGPSNEKGRLSFTYRTPEGFSLTKVYTFTRNSYLIDLEVRLQNLTAGTIDDNLILALTSAPFMDKKRYSFAGLGVLTDSALHEVKMKNLEKELTALNLSKYSLTWAGYEDQYFLASVLPQDRDNTRIKVTPYETDGISLKLIGAPLSLPPGTAKTFNYTVFYGPKDFNLLKSLNNGLEKSIYFGWFDIIAKPLLVSMVWIHQYVPNYGLTIIILTIIIKLLFWPLTAKSYRSMREMQKLQPKIMRLREKHKNNKEALNRETMQLYRTYKVNPMGGCLPMVIQIPVFIAFYRLLDYSLELRHAPFFLWIQDLSAPDRLFHFAIKVPLLEEPTGIPVLTLLMGASMLLQQKMSPSVGDPMQAKMMMMMPIFFTFIFINFPSGLVLYWLVNNILSIGQQYYTNKRGS